MMNDTMANGTTTGMSDMNGTTTGMSDMNGTMTGMDGMNGTMTGMDGMNMEMGWLSSGIYLAFVVILCSNICSVCLYFSMKWIKTKSESIEKKLQGSYYQICELILTNTECHLFQFCIVAGEGDDTQHILLTTGVLWQLTVRKEPAAVGQRDLLHCFHPHAMCLMDVDYPYV